MAPHTAAGAGAESRSPGSMMALQRSMGNAAVVQLLAAEKHEHGPSCGHEAAAGAGAAAGSAVQRRVRPATYEDEMQGGSLVHDVLGKTGQPIPKPLRQEMEARHKGADFSTVRLHDDVVAQRSAAEIGARAYTSGEHIVRGKGGFDNKTLAHELKHVLQQREGEVEGTPTGDGLKMSSKNDRDEREAEDSADEVMQGPAPVQRAAAGHNCSGGGHHHEEEDQ
ncbi:MULTISPECIES: DUF4157 domain-containing protein [unclassified Streptomyces]|uniref:eCIS core domain-containing protein n=1 Tax=unclassified Streptomyces TaxID=2593676 RepID=UPI002E79DFC1|nr:DUF4157 domain-containing protein [Streptomyces sp. JV176]MEE1800347.1 DUF4157 domain-containing protein [Streptomyces sp. JV176]